MYAVVQTGGKQYRVKAGDVIRVGKLEKNLGDKFNLDQVLMVGGDTPTIGSPLVKGASVSVVVTRHDRGAKITTLKRKRRKGYRKTIGHRQEYTELFVSAVSGPGGSEKSDKEPVIFDKEKAAERKAPPELLICAASSAFTLKTSGFVSPLSFVRSRRRVS